MAPELKPGRPWWIAAALLTLGVGGTFGYLQFSRRNPTSSSDAPPAPAVAAIPATPDAAPAPAQDQAEVLNVPDPEDDSVDDRSPAISGKSLGRFIGRKAGVYVDGKPLALMTFGELPVGLKPVWINEEKSAPKAAGEKGPAYVMTQARRYRFTDYLEALGVDLNAIKELHAYGAKESDVIVVSGKELRGPLGQSFYFRFGSETYGKTIPVVPAGFGNAHSPDKLTGVCVYIKKTPPRLIRNKGMAFGDKVVRGVPYYGEPIQGGGRVYFDNRLAIIVKRRDLAGEDENVDPRWNLLALLKTRGFDSTKAVEAWIIASEKRMRRIPGADLVNATLVAVPQTKPYLLIGEEKIRFGVLALHSKPVTQEDMALMAPREDLGEDALPDDRGDTPSPEDGF